MACFDPYRTIIRLLKLRTGGQSCEICKRVCCVDTQAPFTYFCNPYDDLIGSEHFCKKNVFVMK